MKVAIHQPNFLPWLGYFHKMANCDTFVIFDNVQLPTGKSYETRNLIKTKDGPQWLTVPVADKGKAVLIKDAKIAVDNRWQKKHFQSIKFSYQKAPFFNDYIKDLEKIYSGKWTSLCDLNVALIKLMKELLGTKTRLILSSEMTQDKLSGPEKIFIILRELKADTYLSGSGSGSKRYIFPEEFKKNKINLVFQEFVHPVYPQLGTEFIPNLSVIDLLFNCGPESLKIILGKNKNY